MPVGVILPWTAASFMVLVAEEFMTYTSISTELACSTGFEMVSVTLFPGQTWEYVTENIIKNRATMPNLRLIFMLLVFI